MTKHGKRAIVFNVRDGFPDLVVDVPCGQCIGCRLDRSRNWAIRCMHEASLYDDNCFITLTYDDEHLPDDCSLHVEDFQNFMRALRYEFRQQKVRFFHCGEYGEENRRPHYHACLFGVDFKDKIKYTAPKAANAYYVSPTLERLWKKGMHIIGDVSFDSAAYVARYIVKKVTGADAGNHYRKVDYSTGEYVDLKPEYTTMSRRPGIARGWYDKWKKDVYPSDSVIVNGKEVAPPKYYDKLFEIENPEELKRIKIVRQDLPRNVLEDNNPRRLRVKEKVKELNLRRLKRSYEND